MKKLKDFFYDKNDIIIVLLIVIVAGFIIYNRIDNVMSYPEQYAKEVAAKEEKETVPATEPSTEETSETEITITIEDDDTSSSVAEKLQEAGLIYSADGFEDFMENQGKTESIQSGTFKIPNNSSEEEILDIIT